MTQVPFRFLAACVGGLLVVTPGHSQERRADLNSLILAAYEKIKNDPSRIKRGYDKNSFYTKAELPFGEGKIFGKNSPLTMCNAAVAEVVIEALDLYHKRARGTPDPSPFSKVAEEAWNGRLPYDLRFHLFMIKFADQPKYDKFFKVKPRLKSISLLEAFQSDSMPTAFKKFGMAEVHEFAAMQPGDIISFSRTTLGGHSAIFLGFLDKEQNLIVRQPGESRALFEVRIKGFKYFSSQRTVDDKEGAEKGGLDERWAYFKGWCPYSPDVTISRNCADATDISRPAVKANQPRDCCVHRTGDWAPRVGYLLPVEHWGEKFEFRRDALKKQYEAAIAALETELNQRKHEQIKFLVSRPDTIVKTQNIETLRQLRSTFAHEFQGKALTSESSAALYNKLTSELLSELKIRLSEDIRLLAAHSEEFQVPKEFDGVTTD